MRDLIKTIGLYRNKAKNVVELSRRLVAEHGGKVPRDARGAGGAARRRPQDRERRAQRRVRRADHRGRHAHFPRRQPHRHGAGKTPLEVELKLEEVVPDKYKLHAHHWLILHGRYTCIARKPLCETCIINDLCQWPGKTVANSSRELRMARLQTRQDGIDCAIAK